METSKRINVIGVIIGLLLTGFTVFICAQSVLAAELKPRYGGTLTMSDFVEETNIGYPPKIMRPPAMRQGGAALENLLHTDMTGKLVPWLATEVKEDPKAMTITLTIRKGVKFHDGTDFNAEAVKWNLDQQVAEKGLGTNNIKSVEVLNDSNARINLIAWDSTFTASLAQATGLMMSPAAFKKNGKDWCSNNPVGTGPFQIVSRKQDVRTSFKKFDGYWQKGKPYLDRIEFTYIPDPLTREMSLKKKEIDLMGTYNANNLKTLEREGLIVLRRQQPAGARALVFDSANPKSPFADVRVRQAAQYAVDTEAINATIFYGEHEPTFQQIFKGSWAYNPSIVGYPYNPAKAKELLAAAGYANGFRTKLIHRASPENEQMYGAVQNYLKAVGIDAELEPIQVGRQNELVMGGKWEGMLQAAQSNIDVLSMLNEMYTASGKFVNMAVPPDYLQAIKNGIEAKDFQSKQKWTQEALKLQTDKYCLLLNLFVAREFGAQQPYVHNHGFLGNPNTGLWTPEDAWRDE
jgi:peptide/nickel transport system substrate-binding protein